MDKLNVLEGGAAVKLMLINGAYTDCLVGVVWGFPYILACVGMRTWRNW
jgi:hypothetical protein